jgi:hypothetical protein
VLVPVLAFAALGAILLAAPVVTDFRGNGDEIASRVYGRQELACWKPAHEIGLLLRSRASAGSFGSEAQYYRRSGLRAANRWLVDSPAGIASERFFPEVKASAATARASWSRPQCRCRLTRDAA